MKRMLKKLTAHCAIIISGMYIVFFFIDQVNPAMEFIDNEITKALLLVLSLLSILNSIFQIASERKLLLRKIRKSNSLKRR